MPENALTVRPEQDLIEAINSEHRAVEEAARSALSHAIRAGELLTQAKEKVVHGGWGAWLAEHFAGSERTAQLYMRVHDRQAELQGNPQRVADLSLREAARLLAKPKDEPTSETREELLISAEAEIRNGLRRIYQAGDALRRLRDDCISSQEGLSAFEAFCSGHGITAEMANTMMSKDAGSILERALSMDDIFDPVPSWLPEIGSQAIGMYQRGEEHRSLFLQRSEADPRYVWVHQISSTTVDGPGLLETLRRPILENAVIRYLQDLGCFLPQDIEWSYCDAEGESSLKQHLFMGKHSWQVGGVA